MSEEQPVTLKISIPDSLRAQFKSACALQKLTMNETVLALIRDWLKDSKSSGIESKKP